MQDTYEDNKVLTSLSVARFALDLVLDVNDYKGKYTVPTLPIYEKPLVSIIIYACNQWDYIYKCVSSIIKHTEIPFELIIADDYSTDKNNNPGGTITNAVYIRSKDGLSYPLNCNNAAKNAKGKYLLFLSSDTQVQPGWLNALVDLVEQDDTIGLAGPKLVYPDGRLLQAGGIIWNDGSLSSYGRNDTPLKPEYNYVKEADYISGIAVLVRKLIWDDLGGSYEEYITACCKDADLTMTVRKMGYKVIYQPKSIVVCFGNMPYGTDISGDQTKAFDADRLKLYNKWKNIFKKKHCPQKTDLFHARDRSRGKKTILFVSKFIPAFDKSANNRCIHSYLMLCAEIGYHVILLVNDFKKHPPYSDMLEQAGIEILYGPFYRNDWKKWLENNGKYIDYVWLNLPRVSEGFIDAIRCYTRARIAYNGADIHFLRLKAQYELSKEERLLKSIGITEAIERRLYMEADVNLTVSEEEKDVIMNISPQKKCVVFPLFFYNGFPVCKPFRGRTNILFVGGFSHRPNEDAVIWFANEIMTLLPDAKLVIAGSEPPESVKALASDNVTITGYVSDDRLAELYAKCRVAVIPLRFGAGVKGKIIEAIYNLIPVVSTSFGIEGLPIGDLIIPFDEPEGFAGEIMRFLESDNACEETAGRYRQWIMNHFSKQRAIAAVNEMFDEGKEK